MFVCDNKSKHSSYSDASKAAAYTRASNMITCLDTVIFAVSIFVLHLLSLIDSLIFNVILNIRNYQPLKKQKSFDLFSGYFGKQIV